MKLLNKAFFATSLAATAAAALLAIGLTHTAQAGVTQAIDLDFTTAAPSPTQAGFTRYTCSANTDASATRTDGGVTWTLTANGGGSLNGWRDRGVTFTPAPATHALLRDLTYGNGGILLKFTGLTPGLTYSIDIYGYDDTSNTGIVQWRYSTTGVTTGTGTGSNMVGYLWQMNSADVRNVNFVPTPQSGITAPVSYQPFPYDVGRCMVTQSFVAPADGTANFFTTGALVKTNPAGAGGTAFAINGWQLSQPDAGTLSINAGTDKTVSPTAPSVMLRASANGGTGNYSTYSWSPNTGLSDPAVSNPIATPTSTTNYTVTVTDSLGATANDTVTVNYPLVAEAGADQCVSPSSSSATIGGATVANGGTAPFTYSWSPATGLNDATLPNPTASPSVTTTYTVTVTDSATPTAIVATDTVVVRVGDPNLISVDFVYSVNGGTSRPFAGDTTLTGTVNKNAVGELYTGQGVAWNAFNSGSGNANTSTGSLTTIVDGTGGVTTATFKMGAATSAGAAGGQWRNNYISTLAYVGDGGNLRAEQGYIYYPQTTTANHYNWELSGLVANAHYRLTLFGDGGATYTNIANSVGGVVDTEGDWNWSDIQANASGVITGNLLTSGNNDIRGLYGLQLYKIGAVAHAGNSLVAASPGSALADGVHSSTITVTLKDASSNPVAGKAVTLASDRGATDTITPASGVTNALGVVTFAVTSLTTGSPVFTATDTSDTVVLNQTASVTFTASSPVDAGTSLVSASPSSVPADGVTTSTVTVTLKDSGSVPVAGKTVTLASDRGATDTISAASGVSNASGVVTFTVKSTTIGSPVFTATDTSDTVVITQPASVTFTAPPANAGTSTVAAAPSSVTANGTSSSTITVILKDLGGHAVAGKTVTLASSRGTLIDTIAAASGPSDSSGMVTFTVTSTTLGASFFTATDSSDSVTVTQTVTVNFIAPPPSASLSTVTASPTSLLADGLATSIITVTLLDVDGITPIQGKTVTLAKTSGPGTPSITTTLGTSNVSGVATFTVKCVTAGLYVFTATDTTDPVVVTQTASVTFNAPPLVANAGADSYITGTSVQLGGSPTAFGGVPPYTYSWSPATGLSDPAVANPTATVAGTYTLTLTDSATTILTDSVLVIVGSNPNLISVDFVYSDLSIKTPYSGDTLTTGTLNNNAAGEMYTGQAGSWNAILVGNNNGANNSASKTDLTHGDGSATTVAFKMGAATSAGASGGNWKPGYVGTSGGNLREEQAYIYYPTLTSDHFNWELSGLIPNAHYRLTLFGNGGGSYTNIANLVTPVLDAEGDWNWTDIPADASGIIAGKFLNTASNNDVRLIYGLQIELLGGAPSAYGTWATAHAGGGAADEDYNKDGVQNGIAYFMGMNGLATNPGVVDGKVTWDHVGGVASYEVQVSTNLTDWSPAASGDVDIITDPTKVTYTLPTGAAKKFCRLVVTP